MDFDQLHTFLEIVRLKSFSKAAQTCYRTQPAISAQVRQLEQELRADLFERFGSRISLTTAGKIFAEYAEQMLDLRRRAQDAIAELETNPRGELVIAGNETSGRSGAMSLSMMELTSVAGGSRSSRCRCAVPR